MKNAVEDLQNFRGVLLVDKPHGKTSFSLVSALRKKTGVQKIGHAGTLDPFATGLMILLVGRDATRLSNSYLAVDKEYEAVVQFGTSTTSYDCEGTITSSSSRVPTLSEIEAAVNQFQGTIEQTPPMFSAKKVNGKRLYKLARKGITIPREKVAVTLKTTLLNYTYPLLTLHITCSKGTYIRSVAHDLGEVLGISSHLAALKRTRCGNFHLSQSIPGETLYASL